MIDFGDLKLKVAYHKGKDNVADEFYLPCLARATHYDRAVAYFSSSIYIIAWPAMRDFVLRGGKIRIVCSPYLSAADAESIETGYVAKAEELNLAKWEAELNLLVANPSLRKPTLALSALVARGIVDFRIAFVQDPSKAPQHDRLFHSKLGLFYDKNQNCIAFKGSMNESARGLSCDGNIETVDVFVSNAGDRDLQRIEEEKNYFESLWNNNFPGVSVRAFPAALRDLITRVSVGRDLDTLIDDAAEEVLKNENLVGGRKANKKTLFPHQTNALAAWEAQLRRGILEHATGSGKTFTAICAIRSALSKGERPLVLVPSELLLEQWQRELREGLEDLSPQILCAGAGYDKWRNENLLTPWTKKADKPRLVLSTMQTACGELFRKNLSNGEHLFVVADEVHRIGSPELRQALLIPSGPRLGLSATPRRAGDPEGTQAIIDYFGPIVQPPFTLRDAISSERLTPYFYYVHPVRLSESEQQSWDEKSARIGQLFARNKQKADPETQRRITHLLIERSRIAKSAAAKPNLALEVIKKSYRPGERWIVYCDNREQLGEVITLLRSNAIEAAEYHSYMTADPAATLQTFNAVGGVIVSIKCLDEGVDIPATSHALILASSKNPREFIQRRGRVLRKYPGKLMAHIHDAVTIPGPSPEGGDISNSLLRSELARAIQFGRDAANPDSIIDLQRIALAQGVDPDKIANEGYEEDE
jgi:superfamily II DNA or RNA helicase